MNFIVNSGAKRSKIALSKRRYQKICAELRVELCDSGAKRKLPVILKLSHN